MADVSDIAGCPCEGVRGIDIEPAAEGRPRVREPTRIGGHGCTPSSIAAQGLRGIKRSSFTPVWRIYVPTAGLCRRKERPLAVVAQVVVVLVGVIHPLHLLPSHSTFRRKPGSNTP